MRLLVLMIFLIGCSSSVVVKQDKCRGTNVYLSSSGEEKIKKQLVWTPFAPFSRVEEVLFKNFDCPAGHRTSLIFEDDFFSSLTSVVPFFSQTGIFYIH